MQRSDRGLDGFRQNLLADAAAQGHPAAIDADDDQAAVVLQNFHFLPQVKAQASSRARSIRPPR